MCQDLFTYRIRRQNLHGLTLKYISRASSWEGLGRIPVSRCPAEIFIELEKRNAFGPFSTGLCLCITISSPSQRGEYRLLPKRTPEVEFGTKHFAQWLRRDTWRHSSQCLKVQDGWLTVCGGWLDTGLFSPPCSSPCDTQRHSRVEHPSVFSYPIAEVTKVWPTDSWELWDPFRESERLKLFRNKMKALYACCSVLTLALKMGQGH